MTKSSSALMSLMAAIPGALLAFLLVMAFLSHADKMGGTLNAVVGVALLASIATALMPVGILLFGGPKGPAKPKAAKPPKPKKEKKRKGEPAADEELDDDAASLADADSSELVDDELDVEDSSDMVESLDSEDELSSTEDADWDDSAASDEFEFDDSLSDDEFEFDFDDEDDK